MLVVFFLSLFFFFLLLPCSLALVSLFGVGGVVYSFFCLRSGVSFFSFFFLLVLLSFLLLLLFISVEAGPVTRVYTLAMFPFSSRLSCLYIHGRPECTCADSIQVFDDNVT